VRAYSTASAQLWIGRTGKLLRTRPKEARILQLYLITCPNANMYGLYYLPQTIAAEEMGLTPTELATAWAILTELDFAVFDDETQHVWVREMARHQMRTPLKIGDQRVKGANEWYAALPRNPFLRPYYNHYQKDLHLENPRDYAEPTEPEAGIHEIDQRTWMAVTDQLKGRMNRHSFYTWFKDTTLVFEDADRIVVQVPTVMFRDWITKHYKGLVREALAAVGRGDTKIEFVSAEEE
jgi:hypothetical protein